MLISEVIEVRPEGVKYLALINFLDTETGKIYNRRYQCKTEPDSARLDELIAMGKTRIQNELDYEVNDLNLSSDEDVLLEYYRGIKTGIILRIRQFPDATLQQAADYISGKYSDSPFDFAQLYNRWLAITGSVDWSAFKQFCIDHKFREID